MATLRSFLYKFFKSVVPCALLTLSIGFCYAFSLFVPHVVEHLEVSKTAVQFAFCLNIFFLGIGAAFFGPLVEKHIKRAAFVSTSLLFFGLCLSGAAMLCKSLVLLYLGLGVACGISEGCGYVVPVKNLLLWWNKTSKKGLISAISIISFGLGSTLCSWMFRYLFPCFGIEHVFFVFAGIYFIMMLLGTVMIDKPKYAKIQLKKSCSETRGFLEYARDPFFRRSWVFMFLNISMGLVLIGSCVLMLKEVNLREDLIVAVMMLCGIFNGSGRLVFPLISDFLKRRLNIWILILCLEILLMLAPAAFSYAAIIPISIICINAAYGSAFATLPSILEEHYGKLELSVVHGYCLSSWGIASLFAYLCTICVLSFCSSYQFLVYVLVCVYSLNLLNVLSLKKLLKKEV